MSVNYHPSDTREIVKSEFVFDQPPVYDHRDRDRVLSALNRGGKPTGPLSEAFRRNWIELSDDARVWTKSGNNRWLITDGAQNFLIKKEQDIFKVYKRPTIENCALELHHFLEIDPPGNIKDIDFPRYIQPPDPNLISRLRNRQIAQLRQFDQQGIKLYCVDATVDWRLIVGLGGEHVQETNMTLHHIYGIPYIPGSAVKGVLNHWWFQELQEKKDFIDDKGKVDEDKAMKDSDYLDYIKTFGSQEQRGKVKFLDAYPEKVHFATDIMNPHYPKYYGGSEPPTDHQNPVPINFLTVEETTFRFAFLAEKQEHLDHLKTRFKKALKIKGVGAKTAVGYGYFRDFNETKI